MLAARWHRRGDLRLEDVADPRPPAAGEVTVEVSWCGICGTDLEEYTAGPVLIPVDRPNPLSGQRAPLILGHEVSGRVAAVGAGVPGLREGDLVAVDGIMFCGKCFWCRRNQVTLCPSMASIGLMADGGLAERITVAAATCIPVAAHVPDEHAALAEPVSVAVRAMRRGRLGVGEHVLVCGAGTIGLAAVMVARALGAGEVSVIDPVGFRRDLAIRLGAARAVHPNDAVPELFADRNGVGPDLCIDASGVPRATAAAAGLVRAAGRVVVLGVTNAPTTLDTLGLVVREIELIGSLSHVYDEDFAAAVHLIGDGRVDVSALITHRIPLARVVEDGFGALTGGTRDQTLKVLVSPHLTTTTEHAP